MRTTLEIPDQLFRRAKAEASLRGTSLKRFIATALEHELKRNKTSPSKPVNLPLVPSDKPGSVRITAERVAAALDNEDS